MGGAAKRKTIEIWLNAHKIKLIQNVEQNAQEVI